MAISDRGFASMRPEKQRAIASKGAKAIHESGQAHKWNSESARAAARASVAVRIRKAAARKRAKALAAAE